MNQPEQTKKPVNETMLWNAIYFARQQIYQDNTDQLIRGIQNAQSKEVFIGRYVADLVGSIVRDAAQKSQGFDRETVIEVFKQVILDVVQLAAIKEVVSVQSEADAKRIAHKALLAATEAYAKTVKGEADKRKQPPQQTPQTPPQQPPQQPAQGLLQGQAA